MELSTYVIWLIETNEWIFQSNSYDLKHPLATSTFGFGLIEELGEFESEIDLQKAALEAGDVLAYVVLLLHSLGLSKKLITCALEEISPTGSYEYPEANLIAGELKRYVRGDDDVDIDLIVDQCSTMLEFCIYTIDQTLPKIAELNMQKLEARLEKKGTFIGRGDR